jgi:hypothetical protein
MPKANPKRLILGNENKHTPKEKGAYEELFAAFERSPLPLSLRLQSFSRHVRRQDVARFLVKYEIFKRSLAVNGSIVECGVFAGSGLFSWLHFSSILEPYNHTRMVIGFDTFAGFPGLSRKDIQTGTSVHLRKGGLASCGGIRGDLEQLAALHDRNRPLGHIPKVELVEGDAKKTIPRYLKANPHLLVSLLYLDFDLYDVTKIALREFYPRIPKGGILAFDELNCPEYPGETSALLDTLGAVRLERSPYDPHISFAVKE